MKLLQFGSIGVNMDNVTNWEWTNEEYVFGQLHNAKSGYRLFFNRPYDGSDDYVFLTGKAAQAFELWLLSNCENLVAGE